VIESNALLRWYTCVQLGDIYATVYDDVIDSDQTNAVKEYDTNLLGEDFEKVCGFFLFGEPII
jgi:hypothetical protein